MEINTKLLSEDLKKLRKYYLRHPSKDEIIDGYSSFVMLNDLYQLLTGIRVDEDLFLRPDKVQELLNSKTYKNCDEYCDYLDEYLYTWYTLFDNYCDELESIDCIDVPFLSCFRKYSEKEFKDILLGYFSTFGDNEYKIAKKYFDEERIQTGLEIESGDGIYISNSMIKSGYIVTRCKNLETYTQSVIAHELGHAIDRELFLFPQVKRMPFFNDVFLEVPSAFFEIGLYDYLLRNKIDVDGARIQINDVALKVSDSFFPIHSLMKEKQEGEITNIDYYGNVLLKSGENVELRDELLYGLGYYTAFCMHELARGNYKEYMKEFYKFIMSRGEATPKQCIEGLGISFEGYVDGKMITPKIKENTLALKKRFNL